MISYVLIANGQHNPFLATPLPEHMRYPISQHSAEGIDLDYGALLLGERFIIDSSVFEDIKLSKNELFKPMKKSFRELQASEILHCVDFSKIFSENKEKIISMTDILLENVEPWLRLEQMQWRTLKPELLEFQRNYGRYDMKVANTTNIGIESYLARTDQYFNEQLREDLNMLFDEKIRMEQIDIVHIRGALQYIVAQIIMSDLVSHCVKSPILDWDDSQNFYERLYDLRWENANKDITLHQETSKLFNIVLPSLKPNNVNDVIKFIEKNRNVYSLRSAILELIENGESVNSAWITKYQQEVFAADLAIQKKSSVFNFFGMLAGLIPGLPWLGAVSIAGGTTVTDKLIFHNESKYQWYYTLQGNKR